MHCHRNRHRNHFGAQTPVVEIDGRTIGEGARPARSSTAFARSTRIWCAVTAASISRVDYGDTPVVHDERNLALGPTGGRGQVAVRGSASILHYW